MSIEGGLVSLLLSFPSLFILFWPSLPFLSLPVPSLSFSFFFSFPSPLEVGLLNLARGSEGALSVTKAQPKSNLVHFSFKI